MSRSCAWRRTCPDGVSWHQDEALNSTIFILRQTGPTGFLLKEEGEQGKFKVFLGDPHSCTCPTFQRERDLCKHVCWVLLRKFRVPRVNPVTWQKGIVEREINELLRGITEQNVRPSAQAQQLARSAGNDTESGEGDGKDYLEQRPIAAEDVCPICQEEFMAKHLPVTYCKFGCGNSVHIKCMKVWADHQKTTGDTAIKCPLCREDFGPIELLNQEYRNTAITRARQLNQHLGTICKKCHVCPIAGKCYKCTTCQDYHLCQTCFNTSAHNQHSFAFREKPSQRWRPVPHGSSSVLPEAMVSQLMERDLSDQDYDLLLQLDNQAGQQPSDLTEDTIKLFPQERVRQNSAMLAPGQQCRVCLRAYKDGEFVRRLPCRHKFHRDCIDNWLLHRHATCPVDGTLYTNESVKQMREAERQRAQHLRQEQQASRQQRETVQSSDQPVLEIPGIGITRLPNQAGNSNQRNTLSRDRQKLAKGSNVAAQEKKFEVIAGPVTSNLTVNGLSYENTFDYTMASMTEANSSSPSREGTVSGTRRRNSRNSPNPRKREPNIMASPFQIVGDSEFLHFPLDHPPDHPTSMEPIIIPTPYQEMEAVPNSTVQRNSEDSHQGLVLRSSETTPQTHLEQNQEQEPISSDISIENEAMQRNAVRNPSGSRDHVPQATGPIINVSRRGSENSVGSANSQRKPPSGVSSDVSESTGSGRRRGRLRTQPLSRPTNSGESCRNHSASREKESNLEESHKLFVGNDPSTSAGFASDFVVSNFIKGQLKKMNNKVTPDRQRRVGQTDPRHRWGHVQEMQGDGNDIVLSGSKVTTRNINDHPP